MRPLPQRILASAVASALAVAALVVGLVLVTVPDFQDSITRALVETIDPDACEQAPEAWGAGFGRHAVFAYDREGRSANPAAPPVEPALLAEALRTGGVARNAAEEPLSVVVLQRRASGPCAVIRSVALRPDGRMLRSLLWLLGLASVLGMTVAGLGSFWFVVRPFRQRVEVLAEAAGGVGTPGFAVEPSGDDALGHIATVLDASHRRILDTQDRLEARNRALEDHLAGIAHDLRTPLSSMQLALEALASASHGPLQAEARRALTDAVYLGAMVDNLHQGARLRHDLDRVEGEVELGALVARLEPRFRVLGRHAGVEVAVSRPDAPVWAGCTPVLAERALCNLVQNAIEHNDLAERGDGPGHVAVLLQADAEHFTLAVLDDGPGLPPALAASLEAESFLLDAARQRGSGLGMLITAEIARRAGWSLDFQPEAPRGLRATLSGPRRAR